MKPPHSAHSQKVRGRKGCVQRKEVKERLYEGRRDGRTGGLHRYTYVYRHMYRHIVDTGIDIHIDIYEWICLSTNKYMIILVYIYTQYTQYIYINIYI
jgi:hypothetical protein